MITSFYWLIMSQYCHIVCENIQTKLMFNRKNVAIQFSDPEQQAIQ